MKFLVILMSLQSIWSAHDDFRLNHKQSEISHDINRYYEKLSSIMEFSPNYRWQHFRRNSNYHNYRSQKYLNKEFLPFHHQNSYYKGKKSQSKEFYKLRSNPPYVRTLRIEIPIFGKSSKETKPISPFIFNYSHE